MSVGEEVNDIPPPRASFHLEKSGLPPTFPAEVPAQLRSSVKDWVGNKMASQQLCFRLMGLVVLLTLLALRGELHPPSFLFWLFFCFAFVFVRYSLTLCFLHFLWFLTARAVWKMNHRTSECVGCYIREDVLGKEKAAFLETFSSWIFFVSTFFPLSVTM